MRRLLLLILLVLVTVIAVYRQRLFLRDPLGRVFVNDVAVKDAQVFINYSNDVLVLRDEALPLIVQGWDRKPGQPERLSCLGAMVCLTENERAPKAGLPSTAPDPKTTMSNRLVTFLSDAGQSTRVVIR